MTFGTDVIPLNIIPTLHVLIPYQR